MFRVFTLIFFIIPFSNTYVLAKKVVAETYPIGPDLVGANIVYVHKVKLCLNNRLKDICY